MRLDVEALYRAEARRLERVVAGDVGSPVTPAVEDACAFAWERLLGWAGRLREPLNAVGWLRVVARRHYVEAARRDGRQLPHPNVQALCASISDDAAHDARRALESLAALGPHQRRALGLRVGGARYLEIAAECGATYTWVNRHVSKGRAALRAAA